MSDYKDADLKLLEGQVIVSIKGLERGSEEVSITTESGCEFVFYHYQDCCESVALDNYDVTLEDCDGYSCDVIGATITLAEKVTNENDTD